jgi:hypothetical protein
MKHISGWAIAWIEKTKTLFSDKNVTAVNTSGGMLVIFTTNKHDNL